MDEQKHATNENDRAMAKYIAIVVRNAMEDFHARNLSDDQMKQLNPIIRNAVYTALHAVRRVEHSPGAKAFFEFQLRLIPQNWEEPELLEDYLATLALKDRESHGNV